MKKSIDRIDPLSAAKIIGIMYTVFGLIFSPLFILSSLFGNGFGMGAVTGILFAGAVVVFYGLMGFIGSLLMAVLYNAVAPRVGGIEVEVSEREW